MPPAARRASSTPQGILFPGRKGSVAWRVQCRPARAATGLSCRAGKTPSRTDYSPPGLPTHPQRDAEPRVGDRASNKYQSVEKVVIQTVTHLVECRLVRRAGARDLDGQTIRAVHRTITVARA